MAHLNQAFSWWCFRDRGVEADELLARARGIGYTGVELIPRELWDRARGAGLAISSHDGHHSIDKGLNDRAEHARIGEELRANLVLAERYAIPNLIVFAGSRRTGLSEDEGVEIAAEGLRLLARDAEQAGVTLTLELLNSKVDHAGYQADHTAWGRRVIDLVDSPRVKLLYDIYHMQIMEGDLIRTIRENHQAIAHYHTAGNPGRNDMDSEQEINYPAIFRTIAETGYAGYVSHEFVPKGDPLAALGAAYRLCADA